ncbi:MAG: hypothetical protein AAF934_05800 [Bacteroidota bacterium]
MPYTHIQYIGYKVPTVAGVYDDTAPANFPVVPNITFSNFTLNETHSYLDNGFIYDIDIYNSTVNILYKPPTNTPDFEEWESYVTKYLGALIGYLEENPNTTGTIRNEIDTMITYLKYHTFWEDWKIPSAADQSNTAVSILEATTGWVNNTLYPAYTLKGKDDTSDTKYIDDLTADAKNRVIRFLNVLFRAAHNHRYTNNGYHYNKDNGTIDTRETTLKVFTVPEFYFRPKDTIGGSNIYRAYTETVYKAIKEVLQQTIEGMGLNHWLVIPGTIMWYLPENTQRDTITLNTKTYFNSSAYIYTYPAKYWGSYQNSRAVEKAKASHIDGVPYHPWDYGKNAPQVLLKYKNNTHLDQHFFTIDGIKTGLEICLEHIMYNGKGVLAEQTDKSTSAYFNHLLQLQLLVSAGMPTNLPSIKVKQKGLFFRNDGLNNKSLKTGSKPDTYDLKYVDARKSTSFFSRSPVDHTEFPALALKSTVSLNGNNAFELQPPNLQGNEQLEESLPFAQQNIVIFQTHQI